MQAGQGGDVNIGDTVRLRKPHPCGSLRWRVVRLGADIGLVCAGCGRRVLLPRAEFAKRLRAVERPADDPPCSPPDERNCAPSGTP